MTLRLFAHPFSSYCWKALIALYENSTPFAFAMVDSDHPENADELASAWPLRRFPLLKDGEHVVFEATAIIEYLDLIHPGPVRLVPAEPLAAIETRMMDRVFDNYVMGPATAPVYDRLLPGAERNAPAVARAMEGLDRIYPWLDTRLSGRTWAAGEAFGMADCAAAPALFYADWVRPIPESHAALRAYRARLLKRPSVARCVENARPYRPLYPLGAPDRD